MKKSPGPSGATPGGPHVSVAKKRRLAALEETHRTSSPAATTRPALAAAAPAAAAAAPARVVAAAHKRAAGDGADKAKPPGGAEAHLGGGGGSARWAAREALEAAAAQQLVRRGEFPYLALDAASLDHPVSKLLRQSTASASTSGGAAAICGDIDALLLSLLSTGGRAVSAMTQASLSTRMKDRSILLDNPAMSRPPGTPKIKVSEVQLATKLLRGRARARRSHVEADAVRHASLAPLHALWCGYVSRLLASDPAAEARLLMSADLHGADVTVTRARDPRLVGAAGIVCRTTTATWHLVGQDDVQRVLPLDGCVFELQLPGGRRATLVGHNLVRHAARKPASSIQL